MFHAKAQMNAKVQSILFLAVYSFSSYLINFVCRMFVHVIQIAPLQHCSLHEISVCWMVVNVNQIASLRHYSLRETV